MVGLSELARAYVEMVELYKQGATVEARGIYLQICHEMRTLVSQSWSASGQHLAEGDCHAALADIDAILEVHRKNLMNVELPVSKRRCYQHLARIFDRLGQPEAVSAATAMAANDGVGFYQP